MRILEYMNTKKLDIINYFYRVFFVSQTFSLLEELYPPFSSLSSRQFTGFPMILNNCISLIVDKIIFSLDEEHPRFSIMCLSGADLLCCQRCFHAN